jgi:NAD-dependent dihydropyrimidine dehydrogenase PreA subunit
MAAKIDREKCDGCCTCQTQCPTDAIVMEDGKAKVKEDDCITCNSCEDACPKKAITIES